MPEISLISHDAVMLLAGGLAGAAATLLLESLGGLLHRWRHRNDGPPPKAQLHIFDADGDHFLSAKLPSSAVQKLLEDFHSGRLAYPDSRILG